MARLMLWFKTCGFAFFFLGSIEWGLLLLAKKKITEMIQVIIVKGILSDDIGCYYKALTR